MKKQFLLFIEHKTRIWLISILLLLSIIMIFFGVKIYKDIMHTKTSYFDQVKSYVLQETDVVQIHNIERYHGGTLYYVLKAETQEEEVLVFVHEDENQGWVYQTYESDAYFTEKEILNDWKEKCSSCQLLGATVGIMNDYPLLEIKYLNSSERLVYEHVLLEDKSSYRLTLKPSYDEKGD
ncbi:hypothetical protein [Gracilibacillus sp. YIM 98692]|uniref:hypothetical protein n=1 Tax=Gracilibacillus sp. YIM 98692 TaxID=2663532 RepID=UPI0013D4EB10|nr:hypothetical protein [Gracilibacillus sp. YIM 98692]